MKPAPPGRRERPMGSRSCNPGTTTAAMRQPQCSEDARKKRAGRPHGAAWLSTAALRCAGGTRLAARLLDDVHAGGGRGCRRGREGTRAGGDARRLLLGQQLRCGGAGRASAPGVSREAPRKQPPLVASSAVGTPRSTSSGAGGGHAPCGCPRCRSARRQRAGCRESASKGTAMRRRKTRQSTLEATAARCACCARAAAAHLVSCRDSGQREHAQKRKEKDRCGAATARHGLSAACGGG